MHSPMAYHEDSLKAYGLHFIPMRVGAAGLSCHVPARTEGTQSQESVLI